MSVVRISLARFDATQYDTVRQMLAEAQATLAPAIRALKGNLAFYAGIDRAAGGQWPVCRRLERILRPA
jgi:hypothetical protein